MHDAEESVACRRALEGALTALGPGEGKLHGATQLGLGCRQLQALIELHRDVGAEQNLDFDRALGRKLDDGAVEVGAEGHALVLDLAQLRERHDLEAAGVGQNRARPIHESVQAAERRDAFGTRPQHQVIRISEHDIGAACAHRLGRKTFNCCLRADRQERGCGDGAVRRRHLAATGGAVGGEQAEGEDVGHVGAGDCPSGLP